MSSSKKTADRSGRRDATRKFRWEDWFGPDDTPEMMAKDSEQHFDSYQEWAEEQRQRLEGSGEVLPDDFVDGVVQALVGEYGSDKESRAYHQAGHAVLHIIEGHHLDSVAIWRDSDRTWQGRCAGWKENPSQGDAGMARVHIAGLLATGIFYASRHRPIRLCAFTYMGLIESDPEDYVAAREYYKRLYGRKNLDANMEDLLDDTDKKVRDNWGAIEGLAVALVRHETLQGAKATQIIKRCIREGVIRRRAPVLHLVS